MFGYQFQFVFHLVLNYRYMGLMILYIYNQVLFTFKFRSPVFQSCVIFCLVTASIVN